MDRRVSFILITASLIVLAPASALAQPSSSAKGLGKAWFSRLDPGLQIPDQLALRFHNAAVAQGLTPSQAAKMLNDERFAMALGSPDQGFGMLESLINHPDQIPRARELLNDPSLTASGADSIQNAVMEVVPQLRNAYLKDIGLRAVEGPTGALVLVDIETGRQVVGGGRLGGLLRAPGGGPLPSPDVVPPEEQTPQVLAQPTPSPSGDDVRSGGLNVHPERTLMSPWVAVGVGIFVLTWVMFFVGALVRRRAARERSEMAEVTWNFGVGSPDEDADRSDR